MRNVKLIKALNPVLIKVVLFLQRKKKIFLDEFNCNQLGKNCKTNKIHLKSFSNNILKHNKELPQEYDHIIKEKNSRRKLIITLSIKES